MKVAIFGATGATGQILVCLALEAGHEVVAIVRDASKLEPRDHLTVAVVNLDDQTQVTAALVGVDVVLTALGSRHLKAADLLQKASAKIVTAMKANGIKRIIVLGASGALHDPMKYASAGRKVFFKIIRNTMLRHPMHDSAEQQKIIEASGLDYTIVHPPRLTNGPKQGTYRVLPDGLPANGNLLSREDLAEFMIDQISDTQFVRKGPYVAY